MMLRLVLVALAVASASAIVCLPDTCSSVRCTALTAENCVGKIKQNGGFCGCCDACVIQLARGERCMTPLVMGVPPTSECGEGLYCDTQSHTCQILLLSRRSVSTSGNCADRLQEIRNAQSNGLPLLGQFIPSCESDGSYSARQCHGSVCYCADPQGAKILNYEANIGQAADMDCQCARDQHAYTQSGLVGKLFTCTHSGSYQRYACTGSVCYCADELGAMKVGSPTVNIGNIGDLNC